MTSAAAAIPAPSREPDGALRSALLRLADANGTLPERAGSPQALCELLAQAVNETLLPRTYLLEAPGQVGFRFTVANRRLQSFHETGSASPDPLPNAPSSDVARHVLKCLVSACERSPDWLLRLSDRPEVVISGGGSCSAEMLLRTMGQDPRCPRSASQSSPRSLARLDIPTASGSSVSEGDPALIAGLERLAAAFAQMAVGPSSAGSIFPRRAMIVPLSDTHIALISTTGSSCLLQAFHSADMVAVARSADGLSNI